MERLWNQKVKKQNKKLYCFIFPKAVETFKFVATFECQQMCLELCCLSGGKACAVSVLLGLLALLCVVLGPPEAQLSARSESVNVSFVCRTL